MPVLQPVKSGQDAVQPASDSSTEIGYEKDAEREKENDTEQQDETNGSHPESPDIEPGSEMVEARPHPRKDLPTWKWVCTVVALGLGAMLYGLDTTIAADVQASVYEDLGDLENLPWVGIGFSMSSVAVILLLGKIFSQFDVKWISNTSVFIFEVGSAVCGSAQSSNALVVGRVIAGMGGAGMYLGALNYFSIFGTEKESPLLNALIGVCWGIGAILGPVIGGAFSVSSASWRWAFYINLPLAALFSPVYFFVFPSHNPNPSKTIFQRLAILDWVGGILNVGTWVIFMVILVMSGSRYAWDSAFSIALWIIWGVILIAFIVQQKYSLFTRHQIFPTHFLRSRTLILLYITTGCGAASMAVTLYYIPLFFQFTRNDSALDAAVRLLPFICIFIFFILFSAALLPVVAYYPQWYIVGSCLVLAGGACMFTIDATTSKARIYGYEILLAAGSGLMFQNAYAIASAKVAKEDKNSAIGFINVAQIGSTAIALSIAGSLYENVGFTFLKEDLGQFHLPDPVVRSALAGLDSPFMLTASGQARELAVKAVARTISKLFAMSIAAGALGLVSSFGLRWEKLKLEMVAGG
ncbi:major facilitator superfamily domain-containing protein [Xylogone sp. PMI_703]|nr:major facilitator superfamily domain-containing protein [Xylogone sp. PMI_703]